MAAAAKPPKAKPTIIIVAGAWHGLIHIAPLTTALSSQKYPTIPLALTTSGNSDKNLTDDIAMITSHLEEVIGKQGKDVILVLHSFGGVPGCAAAGPFVRSARKKQDQKGGIMAILFIAAFAVPKGMTFLQTLGGKHAPFVVEEGRFCNAAHPQHVFYNDMSPLDAEFYASKLVSHALACFEQMVPDDCFNGAVPCTYLFCERDNGNPPFAQEISIKHIGQGCRVERCDAGHSPYLSKMDLVVNLIKELAGQDS